MSSDNDLERAADGALERLKKSHPDLAAECYLFRGRDRNIELREGELDVLQEAEEAGIGLRVFSGERMAFAFSGGVDVSQVDDLVARCRQQLKHLSSEQSNTLPAPQAPEWTEASAKELDRTLDDPAVFLEPLTDFVPRLRAMETRAMNADPRVNKVLQSGYSENISEVAIVSTTGIRAYERGTSAGVGLYTMAGSGGDLQVGSASRTARLKDLLDFDAVASEAVFRTVSLLDAKKTPSRRRAVVFDPWVAGEILDLLAGPMSAESVQRNRSVLKGKNGEKVASEAVTIIDDPLLPGGVSSSRYDDEGVPTRRKVMIEAGVLKDYFYDTFTAQKAGVSSNGCAGRNGFKGMPGPTCSNFYMAPGQASRDEIIKDTKDGVLVFDVMGMHTADPISGEMSVGVTGVAIENGELTHGVRGAMLSCNLLDVFSRIDKVAKDDLHFYGSLAAPTFRAVDLTIA